MAMYCYFVLAIVFFVVHVTNSQPTIDYGMDRACQGYSYWRIEEVWTEMRKILQRLERMEEQQKATITAPPATVSQSVEQLETHCQEEIITTTTAKLTNISQVRVNQTMDVTIRIGGLVVFKDQLFVAISYNNTIDIIDIYNVTNTLTFHRRLSFSGIRCITDMATCPSCDVIYVADYCDDKVHVIDESGLRKCWHVSGGPLKVSVNTQLILILGRGRLLEYTPSGRLVRRVNLQADVKSPWYAIQFEDNRYLIAHGYVELHRVCIVNNEGTVLTSFGGSRGSSNGQLNIPFRLSLFGEFLFVLDRGNNRVLLLNSSSLTYIQTVFTGNRALNAMTLSEDGSRLYVGDDDKKLHVIDLTWN